MTAKPNSGLHSRRRAITVGAVGAVTAGTAFTVTACAAGDGDGDSQQPGSTPTPTSGATLAVLADIPVGEATAVTTPDDEEIIVSRPTETTAAAFSAICTHQSCKVQPEGAELRCPCHGSVFDALTGEVRNGPADRPLPSVAVTVDGGNVVAG
ncbi:ubiquinol-cytochrome c reductase iron-sulfur subunit [Amycolatopsis marina]|nr:Rieske (2Fe-2S) protein [Amycolatopsis marina]